MMKRRMLARFVLLILISLIVISLIVSGAALAQQPPQPSSSGEMPVPHIDHSANATPLTHQDFLRMGGHDAQRPSGVASTGGPDDFGYTWADGAAYNWIDASSGAALSLHDRCDPLAAAPIGFPFKYYENTYTTVYVGYNGFLTFGPSNNCYAQERQPSVEPPNNVIAPYFGVFATSTASHVRYLTGGAAPNRYLVVEWSQVSGYDNDSYTFEAILYENGDILFQYQSMNYGPSGFTCAGTGIEDARGADGLSYQYCSRMGTSNANRAIRFTRPAPGARVSIYPLYQGQFVAAGDEVVLSIPIHNTGEMGADTYEVSAVSAWPLALYLPDGETPLADTNGNGTLDTGAIAQGAGINLVAKVQTPPTAHIGDSVEAQVAVHSTLDASKMKTANLRLAVPAPFAQGYRDAPDRAMTLALVQPTGQAAKPASAKYSYGYDMTTAETPAGDFVSVWAGYDCSQSSCVENIEYAIQDRYGQITRPVTRLTNNAGAATAVYDSSPIVAVAPNGRIGVVWTRRLANAQSQYNYNILFALLDGNGDLLYGPANVTQNTSWGARSTPGVPEFYQPHVAAAGDNRFMLTWETDQFDANRHHQNSVYYAVRDANGGQLKPITPLAVGAYNGALYFNPFVTRLTGNRALLTLEQGGSSNDIFYAVVDSAGNVVREMTNLTGDYTGGWDWRTPAAAQLSNGRIVLAWSTDVWPDGDQIRFAVLDASYNRVGALVLLQNPANSVGDAYVNVVPQANGRAALTWAKDSSQLDTMYYALVDDNAQVVTQPMIFYTGSDLGINYYGGGATTYSWNPPATDGVLSTRTGWVGGEPGATAAVQVRYANHGGNPLTDVVVSATLADGLTYVSDTSGVTPTVESGVITWRLPNMSFLEDRQFYLRVGVPAAAPYGQQYPVTLTLGTSGADANPTDNAAAASVMAAHQDYLPLLNRAR